MSEFTRVRDTASGHKYSVATNVAENTEGLEVLDEDATDANGRPLPPDLAPSKALSDMKVDELRAYAEERDVDLGGARSKTDIVAAIESQEV